MHRTIVQLRGRIAPIVAAGGLHDGERIAARADVVQVAENLTRPFAQNIELRPRRDRNADPDDKRNAGSNEKNFVHTDHPIGQRGTGRKVLRNMHFLKLG